MNRWALRYAHHRQLRHAHAGNLGGAGGTYRQWVRGAVAHPAINRFGGGTASCTSWQGTHGPQLSVATRRDGRRDVGSTRGCPLGIREGRDTHDGPRTSGPFSTTSKTTNGTVGGGACTLRQQASLKPSALVVEGSIAAPCTSVRLQTTVGGGGLGCCPVLDCRFRLPLAPLVFFFPVPGVIRFSMLSASRFSVVPIAPSSL